MSARLPRSPRTHAVRVQVEGMTALKVGVERFRFVDAYSALFSMPFGWFIVTYLAIYLGANTMFALLYMLDRGSVASAENFGDYLFFSLETFATVGYGEMSPHSLYGHVIASTEILTGVFFTAGLTGLIFSRFSRPQAKIVFSDKLVVGRFRNQPALMLRVASRRSRPMSNLTAQLTVLTWDDLHTPPMRRFTDLTLVRSSSPLLGLSWLLTHPLDEHSPLRDLSRVLGNDPNLSIIATITGYDEAIASNVSARHMYSVADIRLNHGFVDIIGRSPAGMVILDLTRIHDVVPLDDPATDEAEMEAEAATGAETRAETGAETASAQGAGVLG